MIKKKYFLLLSTLLLTAFLGLSGICYAKELTLNDVKNFICNYAVYHNNNYDVETLKTFLDNNETTLQDIIDTLNNNEGQFVVAGSSGVVTFWYYYGSATNLSNYGAWYRGSGYNYIDVNSSYLTRKYCRLNVTNLNNNFTTWQNGNCSVGATSTAFIYTDCIVRNNPTIASATQTIFSAGTNQPYDVFNSVYYTDDYFSFLLNSSLGTITIDGDSVPVYDFQTNQAQSFTLGQLGLAEYFDYAELFEYRWHWDRWKLNKITRLNNIGETTDNLISVTITGSMTNSNTLYSLQMNSDPDTDFANISQPFYIKDRNTVIVNGALDTSATFSGDYGLIYNNNTNTEEIINNTNDDSQVDNILNNNFSGDAEAILHNIGFSSVLGIENPFVSVIANFISNIIDCFTSFENVTLDFGHHGQHMYISSAQFVTDSNLIILVFLKYCLEGLWVYSFVRAGYYLFTKIITADFRGVYSFLSMDSEYYDGVGSVGYGYVSNDWRLL